MKGFSNYRYKKLTLYERVLRDVFAGMASIGLLAGQNEFETIEGIVTTAYKVAEQMLIRRRACTKVRGVWDEMEDEAAR